MEGGAGDPVSTSAQTTQAPNSSVAKVQRSVPPLLLPARPCLRQGQAGHHARQAVGAMACQQQSAAGSARTFARTLVPKLIGTDLSLRCGELRRIPAPWRSIQSLTARIPAVWRRVSPPCSSRQAADRKGLGKAEIPYPQNNPQFRALLALFSSVTL